jgi:hypothetical protein
MESYTLSHLFDEVLVRMELTNGIEFCTDVQLDNVCKAIEEELLKRFAKGA